MFSILTPSESYVYSKLEFHPLYDSFGVEHGINRSICYKHAIPSGWVFIQTPKESNVYKKLICLSIYDSFGVEHGINRSICYKHAIPSGWVFKSVIY